jgi:hypothetical protein
MSFEEQYEAGAYRSGLAPPPVFTGFVPAESTSFAPGGQQQDAVARPPTAVAVPSGPYVRVVRAAYGAGVKLVDVTATLQQLIFNKGGLTLDAFGSHDSMNRLFGG